MKEKKYMYERKNSKFVYYIFDIYNIIYVCYILCEESKKQLEEIYDRLCLKMKNENLEILFEKIKNKMMKDNDK